MLHDAFVKKKKVLTMLGNDNFLLASKHHNIKVPRSDPNGFLQRFILFFSALQNENTILFSIRIISFHAFDDFG